MLGSGAVHREKFFHWGLCDLSARSGVRLVANNSAPRHRVRDQPPPIAIGATVDIGGVGRHLDLGGFRASRQLLVACGDREHRGSCVAIAHPLCKAPGLSSASHPLHRSRRIVHKSRLPQSKGNKDFVSALTLHPICSLVRPWRLEAEIHHQHRSFERHVIHHRAAVLERQIAIGGRHSAP